MIPLYRVYHQQSGISGRVDAAVEHPDGEVLWRVDDHWFFAKDCRNT